MCYPLLILDRTFFSINPLPHTQILGFSDSAANKTIEAPGKQAF